MPDNEILVVCTDLDRTLLPNGTATESALARPLFSQLAARPETVLVYVSGRDKILIQEAIDHYTLPQPDYVIADVGASIYHVTADNWHPNQNWRQHIARDWGSQSSLHIHKEIGHIDKLELQKPEKQGDYKLSYQVTSADDMEQVLTLLHKKLSQIDVKYNCIYSIDETVNQGLIDLLPASASKRLAIDFLARQLDILDHQLVFSGDSGNDLDVLSSRYNAIIVANALPAVKQRAQQKAREYGNEKKLYLASGLSESLNGHYAAGIIEGIIHYYPHVRSWLNMEQHNE